MTDEELDAIRRRHTDHMEWPSPGDLFREARGDVGRLLAALDAAYGRARAAEAVVAAARAFVDDGAKPSPWALRSALAAYDAAAKGGGRRC